MPAREAYFLHWYNLEGGARWHSGTKPRAADGLHWLRLDTEAVSFTIPSQAEVQLVAAPGERLAGVEFFVSNGAGLFLQRLPEFSSDALQHYRLNEPDELQILIRGNGSAQPRYAVFYSDIRHQGKVAEAIALNLEAFQVRDGGLLPQSFYHLPAAQALSLSDIAPGQFQLELYYVYPPSHNGQPSDFRLYWESPEQGLQQLILTAQAQRTPAPESLPQALPLSRRQRLSLALDASTRLFSDSELLIRLSPLPAPAAEESNNPGNAAAAPEFDPAQLTNAQLLQQQLRDPHYPAQTLAALAQLPQSELRLPDSLNDLMRQSIASRLSHQAALLPAASSQPATRRSYLDSAYQLHADRRPYTLLRQHRAALIQGIQQASFYPLQPALDYHLPQRSGATQAQVHLLLPGDKRTAAFKLQLDQEEPLQLLYLPALARAPGQALAGVHGLALHSVLSEYQDSALPWAVELLESPLADVASASFTLPAQTRQIQLQQDTGAPGQVALSYRAEHRYQVREPELLALRQLYSATAMAAQFQQLLDTQCSTAGGTGAPAGSLKYALQQQAETILWPVCRELFDLRAIYLANIQEDQHRLQDWLRGQSDGAQPASTGVAVLTGQDSAFLPLLQRSAELSEQGENYLSDSLLRYVIRHGDKASVSAAYGRLHSRYLAQQDWEHRLQLAVTAYLRFPNAEGLQQVASAMADTGRNASAALLFSLITRPATPSANLLEALLNAGFWQHVAQASSQLPEPERAYWATRLALAQLDFSAATAHYQAASLSQYCVPAQLLNCLPQHQVTSPAALQWRDAAHQVAAFKEQRWFDHLSRASSDPAFVLSPGDQLEFAPGRAQALRILVRQLYPAGSTQSSPDWLLLRGATGEEQHLPLQGLLPNPNLQDANGQWLLGERAEWLLTPAQFAGQHWPERFSLHSVNGPLALQFFSLEGTPAEPTLAAPASTTLSWTQAHCAGWHEWRQRYQIKQNAAAADEPARLSFSASARTQQLTLPPTHLGSSACLWPPPGPPSGLAPAAALIKVPPPAQQQALDLLWQWQQSGASQQLVEAAFKLAQRAPEQAARLAPLLNLASWQSLPVSHGGQGYRSVSPDHWTALSPRQRSRQELSQWPSQARLLDPQRPLQIKLYAASAGEYVLRLHTTQPFFLTPQPARAQLRLDQEALMEIPLAAEQVTQVPLSLAAGYHQFHLSISQRHPNQLFYISIAGLEQDSRQVLNFAVATSDAPLVWELEQPAILRIDRWQDGQIHSQWQIQEQAGALQLGADGDAAQQLLRVSQLVYQAAASATDNGPTSSEQALQAGIRYHPPALAAAPPLPAPPTRPAVVDTLPRGGQEDGTWRYQLNHRRIRPLSDEDNRQPDRYLEFAAAYLQADADARHFSDLSVRYRLRQGGLSAGGDSYGVAARHLRRLGQDQWQWRSQARALGQHDGGRLNWSASLRSSLTYIDTWNAHWYQLPQVELFARHVQRNSTDADAVLDNQVYTRYQDQHAYGYRLGDTWVYQPDLHTQLRLGLVLSSNERLASWDNFSHRLELRRYLQDSDITGYWRRRYAFQDRHRSRASHNDQLGLRLNWELSKSRSRRWTLDISADYDLQSANPVLNFGLSWDRSNGRGYRDDPPGAIHFRELRDQFSE